MKFLFATFVLPILVQFFAPSRAFADFWTGEVQVINGPQSTCTTPSDSIPKATAFQVSSEFRYLACKTYMTNPAMQTYYHLEYATDGEYIRLVPRIGEKYIDPEDYHTSVETAVRTCAQIQHNTQVTSVDLADSLCKGQTLPNN